MAQVRDSVAKGKSLSLALAGTGHVFPPLFLEMTRVGEEAGSLGRVFRNLEVPLPPLAAGPADFPFRDRLADARAGLRDLSSSAH